MTKTLAEMAGLKAQTIVNLERRITPTKSTLNTIKKIAKALDIPTYYITLADQLPETTLFEKLEKARILKCHSITDVCSEIKLDSHAYCDLQNNKKISDLMVQRIIQYIKDPTP